MTKESRKLYRLKNIERMKILEKASRLRRCEKRKVEYKNWSIKNRESLLEKKRAYAQKRSDSGYVWKPKTEQQKQRIKDWNRNYSKKHYHNSIQRKISHLVRCRIGKMVKGEDRSDSSLNLIGITWNGLKSHLEGLFLSDMNWSNYGSLWEIDHILPCRSFDLRKLEAQKICFHYKNLRPRYCHENRSDGSVITQKILKLKKLGLPTDYVSI